MKVGTADELKAALIAEGAYDEAFCDEYCLNRYLRARGGDVGKAAAMLKATLEWRKQTRIDELHVSQFEDSPFMRDGWVYVDANDADGRSVVLFRKRRDKLPPHETERYLRYMTFVLETAVRHMKGGQDKWIWVLDLAAYSPSNAPPLSVTLSVLNMLANHYPERLHKAYIVDAPAVFSLAWKVLYPFVDPVTRSKAEFVSSKDFCSSSSSSGSGSSVTNGRPARSGGSWGSWLSSKAHKSSSSSAAGSAGGGSSSSAAPVDASVVVDDAAGGLKAPAGSSFAAFLPLYSRPYCIQRHKQLLAACW